MQEILHRVIEPSLIASSKIKKRELVFKELEKLIPACMNCICGPLFLMYDPQEREEKMEVGYPVTRQVNREFIETKIVGRCEVYSTFHFGPCDDIDTKIESFIGSLGDIIDKSEVIIREIYHEYYPENEIENVTEIQVLIPLERE